APEVHRQLARWRERAEAVENRPLRALALAKLAGEGFNAELAATLATSVARRRRREVVEALVALEVLFDFLDGLTEAPECAAGADGEHLYRAFTDAVSPAVAPHGDYYAFHAQGDDGGYLAELVSTVRTTLATLPASAPLAPVLLAAAQRSVAAQLRIHAAPITGHEALARWATEQALGAPRQWRELLAGAASSVLSVHALIAAAADARATRERGSQIDQSYLWISALPTILDSLVDRSRDARAGRDGYVELYQSDEELAAQLSELARTAIHQIRATPGSGRHLVTLIGVVAYYCSAPEASGEPARGATAPLMSQLRPLIGPTLALMRAWRLAKRVAKRRGTAPTASRGRSE
ncbi:MAG: DUF2600 family protein, partial [Solirubrobacterales bacterium]|nr:DUF2600 family protein [Solirubrobacterales bacterium]